MCSLYSVYIVQCVHCTLCTLYRVFTVQCDHRTVFTLYTLYTVPCTLGSAHFIFISNHCYVYTLHCIFGSSSVLHTRPSKCLNHHNQQLCKIFLVGVNLLLKTDSILLYNLFFLIVFFTLYLFKISWK